MTINEPIHKPYFVLTEHNRIQVFVFLLILVTAIIIAFAIVLPMLEVMLGDFLKGYVYNHGEEKTFLMESKDDYRQTNYLFLWAMDIYVKTPNEARYWFNPTLSLFLPLSILGVAISVIITSLLPQKLGIMRQKIEREIANTIDKLQFSKFGYYNEGEQRELIQQLLNSEMRDLHDIMEEYKMPLEDLKVLFRALRWRSASLLYKIIHINDGLTMYMRFYFTVKYSNGILGLVYIGAAVLIIIIGLRGLKFIPPTQPSLVLFALGLEFSMLIFYAFTLMYSRPEDETELEVQGKKAESISLSDDLGTSKDIEKLLRAFIKTSKKKT